ncbi:transcriptional regulator, LacI family [Cohaesibacter marisflavi]|uniref:Transcriptional regulator, LacI family n=1 Tax=Cohaesibacter marisflavi TaxID=655353 RepID=A0A1I5HVZ2_9HYPH|nr:substrate-binding domain-containing protein [Cohaesibacter marisflavi]SFO52514.1 transcriptional regulator, LacI family [Cohaesibacter marisflavi]
MHKSEEHDGKGRQSKKSRVTIKEVAYALGISKSTVSRALNGYSDIAEHTRLKVQRTAQELGYKPMIHAQAIRTGLVRSLGMVLNADSHDGHRPFLADFIDGISRRASQDSWTLTVATASHALGVLTTIKRLSDEHTVDGFILPRTRIEDPRVHYLVKAHVPFIMFGRTGDDTECGWYDIDAAKAMQEAVLRLVGMGHVRIGFINGLERYMYAKVRYEGYCEGLKKAGLPYEDCLVRHDAVTRRDGAREGAILLDLPERPTAIICAVDLAALGVYRAAHDRQLMIGSDLSIISYDGIAEGEYASPPLTSFFVDNREAGERLADLLIRRIQGDAPESLRQLGEAHLIARASDGPPVIRSA